MGSLFRALFRNTGSLAFLMLALAFTHSAWAQNNLQLTDKTEKLSIGSFGYITSDPEKQLSAEIITSRYQSNLRGKKNNGKVINFGFKAEPSWLALPVPNASTQENWILDFGSLFNGRTGAFSALIVRNANTGEVFFHGSHKNSTGSRIGKIQNTFVPVRLLAGQTNLLIVYLEPSGGFFNTVTPALLSEGKYFGKLHFKNFIDAFMKVLFIGMAAFFVTVAFLTKDLTTLASAAYYALNLILLMTLNGLFLVTFTAGGQISALLFLGVVISALLMTRSFLRISFQDYNENTAIFGISGVVALCALLGIFIFGEDSALDDILLFGPVLLAMAFMAGFSFLQHQKGRHAGHYYAASWLCAFTGLLISLSSGSSLLPANAFLLNFYWFSLVPQAGFLALANFKKIELVREEERHLEARKMRAEQSLAKLQHSKESADQARLLRVIERERELMAELREREIQRTEEMRIAKEEADQANKAKSAFLAVVSHEIRTPMTGIMGIVRLLMDTKMNEEQEDFVQAVSRSGDTMMALLNDILDFEKIESDNMTLEIIDFDLKKLIEGIATLMKGHAADKGIKIKTDIDSDVPQYIKGDPTRLRQILLNLVNNAIKFTNEGHVTLQVKNKTEAPENGLSLYFAIVDTGIGISAKAQRKLFNPFEQADSSVTRKYGGTGLGLAICRKLVEAMGGEIQVDSEEGVGSTFYFTVQTTEGSAEDAKKLDNDGKTVKKAAGPLDILVLEDNEINQKVLKSFLEKDDHKVTLTSEGEEALEICKSKIFDVVFTDISLAGMSGIETMKAIRALPGGHYKGVPFIASTGNVSDKDVQSYFDAGIKDFLGKPIDYDQLLKILSEVEPQNAPQKKLEENAKAHSGIKKSTKKRSEEDRQRAMDKERNPEVVTPIQQYMKSMESTEARGPEKDKTSMPDKQSETSKIIYDERMLQGLLSSLGKDQLSELLSGFLDKSDEILLGMKQAQDKKDINELKDRAHELKGMTANFGMKEMSKIAGVAEDEANKGNFEAVVDAIEQLPEANMRAKSAINQWLNTTPPD